MANNARRNLPPSPQFDASGSRVGSTQRRKLEFARILQDKMTARGWNQAEMGRKANIGRDLIGTYVRGRSLPEPVNMAKLAKALDCETSDLLPPALEEVAQAAPGSLEMYEAPGHPGEVWLKLERRMSMKKATAILALLNGSEWAEGLIDEALES